MRRQKKKGRRKKVKETSRSRKRRRRRQARRKWRNPLGAFVFFDTQFRMWFLSQLPPNELCLLGHTSSTLRAFVGDKVFPNVELKLQIIAKNLNLNEADADAEVKTAPPPPYIMFPYDRMGTSKEWAVIRNKKCCSHRIRGVPVLCYRDKQIGVHTFSFGLNPNNYQPSGSCNFSRIDNSTFDMSLIKFPKPNYCYYCVLTRKVKLEKKPSVILEYDT